MYCSKSYNKRDGEKMMYFATAVVLALLAGFIWYVAKLQNKPDHK